MSLVINTATPEGLVLAADSRQSYRNLKGMARIGSDNASKLIQLNRRIGVSVTGLAFLQENNTPKNISKFIEEFKHSGGIESLSVKEAAEKLHKLFNDKYKWKEQFREMKKSVENDLKMKGIRNVKFREENHILKFNFKTPQGTMEEGIAALDVIEILVGGYNDDGTHEIYTCTIPGQINKVRKSNEYGSSWLGQGDVVSRIVLGFDGRIVNAPFVKEAIIVNKEEEIHKQLQGLEYMIQWGTMTLQDAIDFCTLMIQTTSAIQRFSDGINADPGDIPGVGGSIDVAVITPDKGFVWINKKKLKFGNNEVDLDKEMDLEEPI